jgi:methyl-accepting chemotaxis protein
MRTTLLHNLSPLVWAQRLLVNTTITQRVVILVSFAIFCQIATVSYQLVQLRGNLLDQRKHELSNLTASALSIAQEEAQNVTKGALAIEEAQAAAKRRIGSLRYSDGGYFWVNDLDANVVMHPFRRDLEGKSAAQMKDPNGVLLFVEFANIAKSAGQGFVFYSWPRPGATEPAPKLSHVVGFKPWGWVIGTGVYIDDLDAVFWSSLKQQAGIVALLIMLCAAASAVIGRALVRSIQVLNRVLDRLAAADFTVEVRGLNRKDELGDMARALQVFKQTLIDKVELERKSEADRQRAELERVEAERAAIESERQLVTSVVGDALNRLSRKDLCYQMTAELPAAYNRLKADFNSAIAQLSEALHEVGHAAGSVNTGAEEISAASDDLSKRTEQQAAGLEETAAALDQISATVTRSAEMSDHAKQQVDAAHAEAERTVEVVKNTILAMDEVNRSSKKISDITGVIDEIAFQTNLLALNAGVEAARAGEAGRGFAVVASEVRALAQRSASAAKEIKSLIEGSSQSVAKGVNLVNATGSGLEGILKKVEDVAASVADMAVGSKEQATSLTEVNKAINEMDKATQQNAAMVEESTAATHALRQTSDKLTSLISQFGVELDEGGQSQRQRWAA